MIDVLTAAQMAAAERAAIAAGGVTGRALMERAGQGVVAALLQEWPDLARMPRRALVLCGPGNNGGDGFVVARLLQGRGWAVDVLLLGCAARLPPDARAKFDRWRAIGAVAPLTPAAAARAAPCDLLVDAVFGTGLSRRLEGAPAEVFACAATLARRSVAVDIASGLCADSGRFLGPAWQPDLTVTFHREKLGHHLGDGGGGALRVVDIGLAGAVEGAVQRLQAGDVAPGLGKAAAGHKFRHGHALVLGGGPGRTGAARLAARAALRIGAGLVTLGVPPAAQAEVAAQITALMLRRVADRAALRAVLADPRINAVCLGPGLGLGAAQADLVAAALEAGRALVLDADALTLIARDGGLFAGLHRGCVLTPHGGEFARLFPDLARALDGPAATGPAYSRVAAARQAAARAGCVVLLKGPDTVIAAPDGTCRLNSARRDRAAPWLATAGAGDVLAGLIAGLLARGMAPLQAAGAAAWLHVEAARGFGPGLVAEDLPEALPAVLRRLGC